MSELFLRDLVPIVELQALELKRLLRDKDRLSRKVDSLIEEIGWLREMQQQDLGLREQDQALRIQMQDTVNDLIRARAGSMPADLVVQSDPTAQPTPASSSGRARLRDASAAKTTLVRASGAVSEELFPTKTENVGIPSFLTTGTTSRSSDGLEPPIRKLLTRIRARNG